LIGGFPRQKVETTMGDGGASGTLKPGPPKLRISVKK